MEDCLIIGGGVIGLSLAYELSGRGVSVRVVDRQQPGREASWAGAGILPPANPATANHPLEQLRAMSHRLHPEWSRQLREETGIDNGYRPCGGIYVARTAGETAALQGLVQEFTELGIEVRRLTREEVAAEEPGLTSDIRVAYLLPDEAQIRNPRHLQALVAACRQRGVEIEDSAEVHEVSLDGSRITGVNTNRGERVAGHYCFTAGAWTFSLLSRLGVYTGIMPIRGQMVLFRGERPLFQRVLNEGPRYLVPRDDGRVLAGSTEEEAGFDKSTTAEAIEELTRLAVELVPELAAAEVERTWSGLRPGSFDGFPYIGELPQLENGTVAAGHFRSGLHLSPGTAVVLSQLICGEEPAIDLAPFRVSRGTCRGRLVPVEV